MRRRAIGTVAAALAVLATAGCGSSGEKLPSSDANTLLGQLDTLETQINNDDCTGANETLTSLYQTTTDLPGRVDRDLKGGLKELLDNLDNLVTTRCAGTTTTTTSSSTTEPTTSTTTEPTTSTTTSTTTDTKPTTSTTSTSSTTTTSTAPDGGSGGTPPGRAKGGD